MALVQKTETPLSGVSCSVTNCMYNGGNMTCEASKIEVSTCDPVQQCSVQCKTFQPRAGR
ncbi:MAG: DUF1540 domain-containing protein [Ruminococcaceae bacterium]|nr:DUF1540 domain-containing protein [Oscillospiraceae bacterium]